MRSPFRVILDMLAPAALVFWILLETYGAFLGPSSARALRQLEAERDALARDVSVIQARRDALRVRADNLNPRNLDPDLVDERVRSVLGYADARDIVIPRVEFDRALKESERRLAGQ